MSTPILRILAVGEAQLCHVLTAGNLQIKSLYSELGAWRKISASQYNLSQQNGQDIQYDEADLMIFVA